MLFVNMVIAFVVFYVCHHILMIVQIMISWMIKSALVPTKTYLRVQGSLLSVMWPAWVGVEFWGENGYMCVSG